MTAPSAGPGGLTAWGEQRRTYLDRMKVVMVAAVIAGHAVIGYGEIGSWPYEEVREAVISDPAEVVVDVLFAPPAMFVMPLFFLVAGLLTPGPLRRKGAARFARDRLLRLGLPWAVSTLLVWPLGIYLTDRYLGDERGSYWSNFLHAEPFLDPGPMWFLLVLLVFSLLYAGWQRGRAAPPRRVVDGPVLTRLVAAVAAGTFALRIVFPIDTEQVLGLHLWQWASCLGLFLLGTLVADDWADGVPAGLRRGCGWAAVGGVVLLVTVIGLADTFGYGYDESSGGLHVPALFVAVAEGLVTVGASVWALGVAAAHDRPWGRTGRAAARAAYGAFLLQGPVLLGLAAAQRPLPFPAEVKALLLAVAGVIVCFALAWELVTKTVAGRAV